MSADIGPGRGGINNRGGTGVDYSDVFTPDPYIKPLPTGGSTYDQGVRCDLNLNCRKVNTPQCDPSKCQASVRSFAKGEVFLR